MISTIRMDHETMTGKPGISEQLIDYLEERLLSGEYPPESRIPSVRRLASKFHLSYGSAMRGIDYLCAQGKLAKSPKRGVYVRERSTIAEDPANRSGRRIVFFIGTQLDADCQSLWYTALLGLSQLASRCGDTILMTPLPHDGSCNRVLRECAAKADGIVIFNSFYWPLEPISSSIPAVGALFDGNLDNTLSVFNLDPLESARTAVAFFRERKIRHVVVCSSDKALFLTRGRLFAALWQADGGSCEINVTAPEEFDGATGYLFTSDQTCQRAHEQARENGKPLPLESAGAILSYDGKRLLRPDFYRFPTIAIDWRMLGQSLYRELCSRMDNPGEPIKNINICGKLTLS